MKQFCPLALAMVFLGLPAWSQPTNPTSTSVPELARSAADLTNQLQELQERLRATDANNALLQAKLKEALSSRPAAIDPLELQKADERIRGLQKDNALLRNALEQAKSSPASDSAEVERLRRSLADANRKLQTQADAAIALIADANVKLQKQTELAAALTQERELLRQRLDEARANTGVATGGAGDSQALARQLQETQTKLAAVQSDRDTLSAQKATLEQELSLARQAGGSSTIAESKQIKNLQRDRDQLRASLDAANKELASASAKPSSAKLAKLNEQLLALRAKLDVYEAKAVPYTKEELALFKKPEPTLVAAGAAAAKKSSSIASSPNAVLVATDRQSASMQMSDAETSVSRVAAKDEKQVRKLCNMATTNAAQGNFDLAGEIIQKALAIEPNDAASLGVLGYLKLSQDKYDEAIETLGRAAKLKPRDPGIQNLLGLALTQKGMRGQAETAFRKALQISPDFPDAHRNLASIYLTQNPPLKELARWHYQKAIAAGHPRVPEIEKLLEENPTASGAAK